VHDHDYPPCAARLAELRERRGLTTAEIAARVGMPEPWVRDLEAEDEELYCNITLADLQRLAGVLGASAAELLLAEPGTGERVAFAGVVARLRSTLAASGESAEEFGERVGWEVDRVLETPEDRWHWCPEELRDIAAGLGIDWVAALPGPYDSPPPRA
jgi:hypothetical protein